MKRIISTLFYCFYCLTAKSLIAQNEPSLLITFNAITPVEEVDFYFNEFIDKRANAQNTTVNKYGMINREVPVKFQDDFSTSMNGVLATMYPSNNKEPLIFVVHNLALSQLKMGLTEFALCRMEIEIGQKISGEFSSLGFFESNIFGEGIELEKFHSNRICAAIENCVRTFSKTVWSKIEEDGTMATKGKDKVDFSKAPIQGEYVSVGQLARNIPLTDSNLDEIKQINVLNHRSFEFSKYTKYVSDGTYIYWYMPTAEESRKMIKSTKYGKFLCFRINSNFTEAVRFFGLIGVEISIGEKIVYMDVENGEIGELTEAKLYALTKNYHPEIFSKFRKTRKSKVDFENAIQELNATYK